MAITSINNGVIQFGVDLIQGGGFVELKFLGGSNYVDNSGPGRQIVSSLYEGGGLYTDQTPGTGTWGWNPVENGDIYGHWAPVLTSNVGIDSIYTKVRPYDYFPDNKGGGAGTPVYADCYMEKTISFITNQPKALKVTYRITYFGTATRRSTSQELPSCYFTAAYNKFVRYAGDHPWTNAAVLTQTLPENSQAGQKVVYCGEFWCAFVDTNNDGISLFTPGHMPQYGVVGIANASPATNYMKPTVFQGFSQNQVLDYTFWIVLGNATQARTIIRQIHNSIGIIPQVHAGRRRAA